MFEPLISTKKKCLLFVTKVKGITFQTFLRQKEDELCHEVVQDQVQEIEEVNTNEDEVSQSLIQVHEKERKEN